MKKHLEAPSLLRRATAARPRAGRKRTTTPAVVALVILALSSASFAAAGAARNVLRRGSSPFSRSLVAAPSAWQPLLAGAALLAPLPQSNALNVARTGHTATRLPDGTVLVVGGEGAAGPLSSSEIFDPATRTFSPGASAAAARTEHAALRLNDGRVLITGGRNQGGTLDSTEVYDPTTGTFAPGPSMTRARSGHTATLLADGRVLVAGGDQDGTAEIFDAQAAATTPLDEPLYTARVHHSALLLRDGKVLVVGGSGPFGNDVQSAEMFDPAEETFAAVTGAMKVPRTRPTLREMPNGLVQVVGGDKDGTIEMYVPATDDFQAYAHLPGSTPVADALGARTRSALFRTNQTDALLNRAAHTVTEIPQSNLALVAGGADGDGQILNSVAVVNSSAATVTTDKIDYAPGQLVTITGAGFQPNETVTLVLHEEQSAHGDRTFTSVADGAGNFTNTDFTPEAHHFGVHFVLTARGQSSGFVAQTAFTDAGNIDVRVTVGNTFRSYGQTAPPLRVNLCTPLTDGSGDCTPINGKTIEFAVNGVVVGSDVTSTKDTGGGVMSEGMAVVPYDVLKNFGTYTIVASFAGDDEYQADQGTSMLRVGLAHTTITWATPAPVAYGTALGATQLNATIRDTTSGSQFNGQPVAGSFNYTLVTGSIPAMGHVPNAGSNQLRAAFAPADTLNYGPNSLTRSVSVTKGLLTVTPNSYVRLYGQPNPELTGTVTGLVNNDPITPVFATTATQATGVGTRDITFTFNDPADKLRNYNQPAPLRKGTLAINKAPLTLKADDKTRRFGVDNPALTFTYSGFVLGENAGVLGGAPTLSTTANAASPAAAYPITLSVAGMTAANYDLVAEGGTLTVTKAESVLNLSGLSQTYDGTPKAVTVTTSPPGLSGVSVLYLHDAAELYTAPADADTYTVIATLDHPDYKAEPVTGTLVIHKANQAIDFPPLPDRKFGDAPFALAATASSGLPVAFEVVSGNATLSGKTLTLTGAGEVTVRATQAGDSNRNPAPAVTRTFRADKADATINVLPASLSQTYNGTPRTATVTTTPAGLGGLVVSYTQDGAAVAAPTNAGTYGVSASLDNANYRAAPVTATLVVAQATVQVDLADATHVFDGRPHPVSATVTGGDDRNVGTLTYSYTPQGNVGPDTFEPPLPAPPASTPGPVPPAPAYAVLNDPPATPHNITVFPERDFVSAENYSASDGQVTINVLRRDPTTGALVTVGSATATPQDDPTTPQFDGVFEVNHPGGSCWVGSTPNIRPGDIVRVTNAAGVADQTTVARVSAGRPVQINANTVRISGRAMDAAGDPLPLGQLEQRLISSSADPFVLSGRRDLRAPGNGVLVYDDEDDPTHWTATYTGLTPADVARALRVESRILWLGRDEADENELTIFEIGDDVFAGPQAPCNAPLEGSTPVMPFPVPPAPAYTTLNEPPVAPRLITVFPERDFVSIENFAAADGPNVTINVLRSVTMNGATTLRTVGSSTVELGDDPTTPQFDGIAEVNHPGGGCWVGSTPDIRPGDLVRVTTASGVAHQTRVANVVARRVEQLNANTVVVHGTAQDAAGNPLPIDELEQRMISGSADRFNVNGRRDIRAVAEVGEEVGTLAYDAPGSVHWTATYTNLGSQDVARALRSETRILWLGRDPAAENEVTIFEIGDDVFQGPQAPCNAPREGSDLPVWVGVYDVSVSLAGNPNYRVAADTARITITKATPTVNVSGGPFEYDGQPHAATVSVTGIDGQEFVPPTANTTTTYVYTVTGDATTNPPAAAGVYPTTASFAASRNYTAAQGTHQLIIENAKPVVEDKSVTTDEDKAVSITFNATDPNGGTLSFSVVRQPANGTVFISGRMLCAQQDVPLGGGGPAPLDGGVDDVNIVGGRAVSCTVFGTYTPNANFNGTDTFTYKASDGQHDSNEATVTVTVNPVNDAPQVNAGPDASISEGGTFTSGGSFADADNAGAWTATVNYGDGTGVQPLALTTNKTFALSHVYKDSGPYTVTVNVADNAGGSSSDTALVTSLNVAPGVTITNAPITSPEGTPITLGSGVSDPSEADTAAGFKYLWTVKKNGAAYAQSTEALHQAGYTFTPDEDGLYEVTVRATDKDGGAGSKSRTITVTNVEHNDDFNDNTTDAAKWIVSTSPDTTLVEQNQRLEITPAATTTGYGGYVARTNFNLTNSRATVEVVQATPSYGIETYFHLADKTTTATTDMMFVVGGPNLLMQDRVNGTIVSRIFIPYNATEHRFWRFRHDPADDTVKWETSANGLAWTVRHSAPRHINLTKIQTTLSAGKYTATTAPITAVFDNYRAEPNPTPPLIMSDDFNDNSMSTAKWALDAPNTSPVTAVEQNQRLEITPSPTLTGYNGFSSANSIDFTNAQAAVEVLQTSTGSSNTLLRVGVSDSDYIQIVTESGILCFQYWIGPSRSQTTTTYNPAQHRFWRIRHEPLTDSIVWETSADNTSWVVQRFAPRPMPVTSTRVRLMAGKWTNANSATPGVAVFDNVLVERRPAMLTPSDNFNDNAVDPAKWTILNTAALTTLKEQNGRVEIALQPNVASYNGVMSVPQTNFWNKTLSVDMPQVTNGGGAWAETYFRLMRNDSNYFQVIVTGANTLVLDAVTNGVRDRTAPGYHNLATQRFWRFRHNAAAHTMNFETSGDGVTWTTLKTVGVNFPLDNMRVNLQAGAWGTGNASPGMAVYDNLKLESNE